MCARSQANTQNARARTHKTSFFIMVDVHIGDSLELEGREVRERDGERDGWAQHKRWSTHASPASSFHSIFSLVHFRSLGIFLYFLFVFFVGPSIFWPPYIQWAQDFPQHMTSRSLPPLQAGMCVCVCVSQLPETLTKPLIRPIRTDTSPPPRGTVGGEEGFLLAATGVAVNRQDRCVFLKRRHKTQTGPEVEERWNIFFFYTSAT